MQAINLSVPTAWTELDDKQLRYIYKLIAANFNLAMVQAHCFFHWTKTQLISSYGDGSYLLRIGKIDVVASPTDIAELLAPLEWIGQLPLSPLRLPRLGYRRALSTDFENVPFETFLICENLYQGFLHTQQDRFLDELAALLYPKRSSLLARFTPFRLTPADLINIFYWFASLKDHFARRFPDFLQPLQSGTENLLGSSPNIGAQLQESMDAQIRALTKGDITKEREILAMDTWRALTELNAQAKEYKQLNDKLKIK
jgi:hypothetical protein